MNVTRCGRPHYTNACPCDRSRFPFGVHASSLNEWLKCSALRLQQGARGRQHSHPQGARQAHAATAAAAASGQAASRALSSSGQAVRTACRLRSRRARSTTGAAPRRRSGRPARTGLPRLRDRDILDEAHEARAVPPAAAERAACWCIRGGARAATGQEGDVSLATAARRRGS